MMIKTSELYKKALNRLIDGDELSYELFKVYISITAPFRKFYRFVKRLQRWIPVLWNNEDWDFRYLLDVIELKLTELERDQREDSNHIGGQKRAREIKTTLERIKRYNDSEIILSEEEKSIVDEYCSTLDFHESDYKRKRTKISYKFIWKYPFVEEVKEEVEESTYTLDSLSSPEIQEKYHKIIEKQMKEEEKSWKMIWRNISRAGQSWWS